MRHFVTAAVLAASLGAPAHAAQQFIDQQAFTAALDAAGLTGQGGVPTVTGKVYGDSYGPWTLADYGGLNARLSAIPPPFTGHTPTSFGAEFSCLGSSYYVGCVGVNAVTLTFAEPVQAISGWLTYLTWFSTFASQGLAEIDNALVPATGPFVGSRYTGFWGIILDAPVTSFTLTRIPEASGHSASFMLAPVPLPEPAGWLLLCVALAGLVALDKRARA